MPNINVKKRKGCRKSRKKDKKYTKNLKIQYQKKMKMSLSCKFCDMKSSYKIRLEKHEQMHLRGLKCHLCNENFSTIKQLRNHIDVNSKKGVHLCQHVENSSRSQKILFVKEFIMELSRINVIRAASIDSLAFSQY